MSVIETNETETVAHQPVKRKRVWIVAAVIILLAVLGALWLNHTDSASPEATGQHNVSAAAAETAWNNRTAAEKEQICTAYTANKAMALNAIKGGIGGNDPALLAAFDNLLSQSC